MLYTILHVPSNQYVCTVSSYSSGGISRKTYFNPKNLSNPKATIKNYLFKWTAKLELWSKVPKSRRCEYIIVEYTDPSLNEDDNYE